MSYKVLPRPRPIDLSKQHDPRRQERAGAEPLHGTADDEGDGGGGEARGEGPYGEPEHSGVEDEVAAVHVCEAAEGEEEGAGGEGED